MRKTEKNKITISGVASIEQILTVIGAHLEDIVEEFGAKAFCDIGFYFNSYNGINKFTIASDEKLLEHNYEGYKAPKKVSKKEELKNFEQQLPVNYESLAERIPNMRLRITENREKQKAELERSNNIKKENEEIQNKAIKKRNLISLLCDVVKNEHILNNGLASSKGIKVWCIQNVATGMKHFPDINKNEIKVPFFLLTHDDKKFMYYKPEINSVK